MGLKTRDITNLERCERKYQLENLITTRKNKYFYKIVGIRKIVKEALLLQGEAFTNFIKRESIKEKLDEFIPDDTFLPLAKMETIEEKTTELIRYLNFLHANSYEVLRTNIAQDIVISGEIITVSADFILNSPNGIEVVKIKRRAPEMSYRARVFENKPENNLELFLMSLLGSQIYPNENIVSSFHHMKNKDDGKIDGLDYESKKGKNIISYSFKEEEVENNVERIVQLIKVSKGDIFEKDYQKNKCNSCPYVNTCDYTKPSKVELEELEELAKAPIDFKLTDAQRRAVLFRNGVARINAGAGSGKTTVVALRVVELILDGCDPSEIFLTTFTNKGALEMKEKIAFWLNKEGIEIDVSKLNITTFNAWGDRMIAEHYKKLGFTEPPTLIDKVEKYDILFKIIKSQPRLESFNYKNPILNFRYAKGIVPELDNLFGYIKAYDANSKEALATKCESNEIDIILEMYKIYNSILRERNLIEYQDQINLISELIKQGGSLLNRENYKHVIIDEYQDSDFMQVELISFLSKQPNFQSLMVVGDDAQAIFGFRNTSQKNIIEFHKIFEDVEDINIIDNFRSTPEIIELANAINDLNKEKIDKTLISGNPSGNLPTMIYFDDNNVEHKFIAKKSEELLKDSWNPEDIAVIARTKYELFNIANQLQELELPYIIDVPEPLLNNSNIHIAKSLISSLDNIETNQGIFEYLYALSNGFEGLSKEEMETLLYEETKALKDIFEEVGEENHELLDEIKEDLFYNILSLIDDSVLNEFLEDLKVKNLRFHDLKRYIYKFIEYEDGKTVEVNDKRYRGIVLTTAHSSKGKEYPVVFNTISKYTPDRSIEAIEEERRLLFVSVTRAKSELFITSVIPKRNNFRRKNYHGFPMEIMDTGKCIVGKGVDTEEIKDKNIA